MSRIETVSLSSIVPYWRNPRVITDEAVLKTAESIETYGYQQPIIVNSEMTIIAGHTRYAALKRLGWTEVPVIVSDLDGASEKAYRVIDNKTGEYTGWDSDLLRSELAKFEQEVLDSYFPNLGEEGLEGELPQFDAESLEDLFSSAYEAEQVEEETLPLTCIYCFEETHIPVSEWLAMAERYSK